MGHKRDRCKKDISGLYSGSFEKTLGDPESLAISLEKDGSVTAVGRFEYPQWIPGVNDIESAFVGQWRRNCDNTYTLIVIQQRQAAEGGGVPGVLGYTNANIPTLPNYVLVGYFNFIINDLGNMVITKVNFSLGPQGFKVSQGGLVPFTKIVPFVVPFTLEKQRIDAIKVAVDINNA